MLEQSLVRPVLKIAQPCTSALSPASKHYLPGLQPGMIFCARRRMVFIEAPLVKIEHLESCFVTADKGADQVFDVSTSPPIDFNQWDWSANPKVEVSHRKSITMAFLLFVRLQYDTESYSLMLYRTNEKDCPADKFYQFYAEWGSVPFRLETEKKTKKNTDYWEFLIH